MLALDMQKWSSSRRRTFFALLVETLLATLCVMGRQMDQQNAKLIIYTNLTEQRRRNLFLPRAPHLRSFLSESRERKQK
jgi:hypothetical protein